MVSKVEGYSGRIKKEGRHRLGISKTYKDFSQFSPIEDKETLVRLAIVYKPFWNLDNGESLCYDCHKKTDSYLIHKKEKCDG